MIRKFSVLYVGQIDLDHVGRDGTPADLRRYPNERVVEAYRSMVDVARVMDDEGYYCLWTAEHHFQREGYEVLPNLILVGTYLAAVTRQLKLGCAFNILPMWHPIRLAEDYAVADILTGGRVIMGIGRGYHTREVESFGAPSLDAAANLELFEEQFELHVEGAPRGAVLAPRQALHGPARREVPGVRPDRGDPGPPPDPPAGRDLAADRERQDDRLPGQARPEGHGHAERRADHRPGLPRLPGRVRAPRSGRSASARTSASVSGSTWRRPRRRPSGASSPPTTSATSGSRRSASCATRTSRAGPGARRARRRGPR